MHAYFAASQPSPVSVPNVFLRAWKSQECVARFKELHDLRWGELRLRLFFRRLHIAQDLDERALTSSGGGYATREGGGGGGQQKGANVWNFRRKQLLFWKAVELPRA